MGLGGIENVCGFDALIWCLESKDFYEKNFDTFLKLFKFKKLKNAILLDKWSESGWERQLKAFTCEWKSFSDQATFQLKTCIQTLNFDENWKLKFLYSKTYQNLEISEI